MICLLFATDDVIPGKHNQTAYWVLNIDNRSRKKTHRHTDKHRNGFLKHKRVKHFLSNLNNNENETSASWYDVTHDDDVRRIAIQKRSLNFFFLAFCGVIYQNLLHRRVYIAVSSSKLLFRQFCEKLLHITFKPIWISMKQEMMGWQWSQLNHLQIICTSLQSDNHAITSTLKFLQARCSSWRPTNSV